MTLEELRFSLHYCPDTGNFVWKISPQNKIRVGQRAGRTMPNGYKRVRVLGREYEAHRLAWFYVNGEWPNGDIDHINHDPSDNRIENLRVATRSQNLAHRKAWSGSSGFRGVAKIGEMFRASISCIDLRTNKRINKYLGKYSTPQEASEVFELMSNMIHGEFCDGRA